MTLRIGSLVYACESGLGILAKSFVNHKVVTDVLVIRHSKHPSRDEWYPNAPTVPAARVHHPGERKVMEDFCKSVDAVLFFETPFEWDLVPFCKSHGVKTVLMPMYECFQPHRLTDARFRPDLFLCPSHLDYEVFKGKGPCVHLPVPVEYPWRQRTEAKVFVHNAGHGGLKGRNGTAEVLEAMRHVKSDAKLLLRAQESSICKEAFLDPKNISTQFGTLRYGSLFAEGDVFLFPEKFNGLSLPLQEARAAGMLVMCGDRFPMNAWLPREPLIPVAGYSKNRVGGSYMEFDEARFDPRAIAATIDEWYGKDISDYSRGGKAWAETMSWAALGPKYAEVLEGVCK